MISKLVSYTNFFRRMSGILSLMKGVDADSEVLVPDEIEATIDKHANKTAFLFEGQAVSFSEFERRANKVADWAIKLDYHAGDTVALVMENCPDYVAIWFGLSKVGVTTALINSNLEGAGLVHCINIVGARAIVASGTQAANVQKILSEIDGEPPFWDLDGEAGPSLEEALTDCSSTRPSRQFREGLNGAHTCVFIYTSGTTGLPKAAKITQSRLRRAMRMPLVLAKVTSDDVVYNVLPLYHITGGGLGLGATLLFGAATQLQRRFSASGFWDDVSESGATAFVYIGELCRYLLNSPEHPKERSHNLRVGFGNGLRGDVWSGFVERFQVTSMRELYGSTEGNVSFLNLDGKVGAVGQSPRFLDKKLGISFVKFDIEKEAPVRNETGFCLKCDVDEPGEVLGRISDEGRESFEGYHDKAATEKKILTDVFEPGDKWFRTGDLMSRDKLGYVRFIDRIGDTFRWKGENVATNEVSDILSKFDGIELANVYGVEVPGADGRAGMAAITSRGPIDFAGLAGHLAANLPSYAVPLFIREQTEADTTGTFKFKKVDAVKEGFDVTKISDPVWILSAREGTFKPLTEQLYLEVLDQKIRL